MLPGHNWLMLPTHNRVRRQSGFPTFISCQHQDPNVLPKQRQSHQGDKLCDVSTVPLVARWPVILACGSDADGEPHWLMLPVHDWLMLPTHNWLMLPIHNWLMPPVHNWLMLSVIDLANNKMHTHSI